MEENVKKISFEEAVISNFFNVENGQTKIIKIVDWYTYENSKFNEIRPAFKARVIFEDGEEIANEKYCWDTTSQPVMRILLPILKDKDDKVPVTLKVSRIGDRSDTKYTIEEVKNESN